MPSDYTPQRVVCLQPSATLTLRDLGLLDRVVACTKYCADVCPEAADGSRLIVSDSWTAQAEQIRTAQPDLVLASVPYQLEAVGEILKAGVRFLALAPRTLADIYADIVAIAGIMGVSERGEHVASAGPDVLLAAWCGAGDRVPLEKLVEQRNWSDLPAVRARRVFCISDELLNTPATSLLGGLRAIAWALHPDRFPRPSGIRQLGDL